jgi:hypothetical protein
VGDKHLSSLVANKTVLVIHDQTVVQIQGVEPHCVVELQAVAFVAVALLSTAQDTAVGLGGDRNYS